MLTFVTYASWLKDLKEGGFSAGSPPGNYKIENHSKKRVEGDVIEGDDGQKPYIWRDAKCTSCRVDCNQMVWS